MFYHELKLHSFPLNDVLSWSIPDINKTVSFYFFTFHLEYLFKIQVGWTQESEFWCEVGSGRWLIGIPPTPACATKRAAPNND